MKDPRKITKLGNETRSSRERSLRASAGFTLIEVAIAVALIGFAMTTLITMQTGFADTYLRERALTKAGLYAQYLLTMADISNQPPDEGNTENSLQEVLQQAGYFEQLDDQSAMEESTRMQGWTVRTEVKKIGIAPIEDALRELHMTVAWSPSPQDQFTITYYLPGAGTPGS